MDKPLVFDIDPGVSSMIERLDYEVNARRQCVAYIIDSHSIDPTAAVLDSEVFKTYHEQLVEAISAFEIAKQKFEASFASRNIPAGTWRLDYNTSKLFVIPNQDTPCNCNCKKNTTDNNQSVEHNDDDTTNVTDQLVLESRCRERILGDSDE